MPLHERRSVHNMAEKVVQTPGEVKPEKASILGTVPVLIRTELALLKHICTGPLRGSKGPRTYRQDICYAATRQLLAGLSTAQAQLAPGTDWMYKRAALRGASKPNTVDLGLGAKGHWIGDKHAECVMLFIHGGGFYGAASIGHFKYQFALEKEMRKKGHDMAIFSLSYTLSPEVVYPTQLRQAVLALRHLLEVEHRTPSSIILGGDSAGANLASALLLHLARPHPAVPAMLLSHPLHAAVLISPWISFDVEGPSFKENYRSDYLTVTALKRASQAYIAAGTQHDNYSQPISAPADWWKDVASGVLNHLLVWGGETEILIDGIRKFATTIEKGFEDAGSDPTAAKGSSDRFTFIVTPRHGHEEMIMDYTLYARKKGEGALKVEDWLLKILKPER